MGDLASLGLGILWVIVIVEGLLLLGALRQIGRLWERIGPERPMWVASEIATGSTLSAAWIPPTGGRQALLFVSPTCGVCEQVLDGLARLIDSAELFIVCNASPEAAREYLGKYGLGSTPHLPDPDGQLAESIGVRETPFAVVIDAERRVESTSVVNSPRQVEAILSAQAAA